MPVPNTQTHQPDGIIGLFINGESLFPHSARNQTVTQSTFPTANILRLLTEFAQQFGSDLRERVLVRNWDDPAVSSPNRLIVGHLQTGLFQLIHVPRELIDTAKTSPPTPKERESELVGQLGRLAASWATRTREVEVSRPVTVVLAGRAKVSELPDDISVHTVQFRDAKVNGSPPELVIGDASSIDIHQRLWRP